MDIDKDIKKIPKSKRGEKNIFVTIFKIISVVLLLALQIGIMLLLYTTARGVYVYARLIFDVIKIVAILYLLYHHDSAAYKISWILFILFFPVVGLVAYILWGNSKLKKKRALELKKVRTDTEDLLKNSEDLAIKIKSEDAYKYNMVNYATKISGYPLYENEGVEYFEIGEKFFDSLKKDLQKAEKYILLEFFIISKGRLWNEIFEILKVKSKNGVKVEMIVDSLGSLFKLPKNFTKDLENENIEVNYFNPFTLILNGYINYRDHRKIVVIDGKIAYTGGVNLADEYANIIERYGHWKDGGVKIIGSATWSYTLMYLRNKEQITKRQVDYMWYKPLTSKSKKEGYVLPFADGPDNRKNPIENIYIQMVNYAKSYVYITTPYLILSENLLTALLNSARSGVSVKIVTPHIPDKKMVQIATRSYYEVLLEAGVEIFEYKPGFIHSKTMVSDDDTAIIGTANLDFRSLHLNFECVNFMYKTGEEISVKEDFERMTKKCIKIDLTSWKNRPTIQKFKEAFIAAFSPML